MGSFVWPARAWGVEKLSKEERVAKIINAGVDQFGGENCPEVIVQLVKDGKISEKRIDESVKRLLRQKFQLRLFDDPYVDVFNRKKFLAMQQVKKKVKLRNEERSHC
jgi:beta-glucosidase